jgi:hypothetical protein
MDRKKIYLKLEDKDTGIEGDFQGVIGVAFDTTGQRLDQKVFLTGAFNNKTTTIMMTQLIAQVSLHLMNSSFDRSTLAATIEQAALHPQRVMNSINQHFDGRHEPQADRKKDGPVDITDFMKGFAEFLKEKSDYTEYLKAREEGRYYPDPRD